MPGPPCWSSASAAALAALRTRPVAVLAAVFGIVLAYLAIGYPDGPIWLTLIIAYFTAVLYGHRWSAWPRRSPCSASSS